MLSFLLMKKIIAMVFTALFGYVIVKAKLLKPEDKNVLNVLSLYAINPCVIISSYQVELTEDKMEGLVLTVAAAVVVHIAFIFLTFLSKKALKLSNSEQMAVIYTNCGGLIIPMVGAVLGKEYIFYVCSYIVVQTVLFWTHGIMLMGEGQDGVSLKKIFANPNMWAVIIGLLLFLGQVSLPETLLDTISGVGDMCGPMVMIIMGMIVADMNLKEIFRTKRAYLISFLRLILLPLLFILVVRMTGITLYSEEIYAAMLVTLLAVSAPIATGVVMVSLLYDADVKYVSTVNIMSLVLCIVTMPLLVLVYQMVC